MAKLEGKFRIWYRYTHIVWADSVFSPQLASWCSVYIPTLPPYGLLGSFFGDFLCLGSVGKRELDVYNYDSINVLICTACYNLILERTISVWMIIVWKPSWQPRRAQTLIPRFSTLKHSGFLSFSFPPHGYARAPSCARCAMAVSLSILPIDPYDNIRSFDPR